ncbi:MAG: WD40 repeat domain-containing protein [Clostridiales Family XIII bacterium]|jgi:hypothetical protein|nr:WD40 repeat domain-containing protein [Clostridiales Family XIII bacterium]
MRKHQQRQILELIETIRQAQTAGLFADCQEGALGVGSFIESTEGEGTKTVALLEEYCDLLFAASGGEIGEKQLRKHLIKIENSVRDELAPNRIEVVFFPYQLSMWDALESVYLAAKADPRCDVYCVPVPWYELNPDGSPGKMRCDAGEYPADIPVTDWREYDAQARHPDAIFVHNPYDGGNLVTRVHPDFYCERLRGFTDLLVYIPYFVTSGDVLEHFCTLAGCVYAHRVIVQSEAVRDTYVRVFKAAYGDRFGRPEDKFLALGSPKFDKALGTRREDCALPERWRRLLAGRKAVFYNTSVGALLAGNEQYLRKLRQVFDTFKNRGDVVLWWRPHPLNEATCRAMRPGLLDAYKKIIADYRRAGFGIYDDTPDLHRAVAWTDAYYGDGSSVVALYEASGKPVMVQSLFTNYRKDDRLPLVMNYFCFTAGFLWFASAEFNGLFKMDLDTWDVRCVGSFPNEPFAKRDMYGGVIECDGKLCFAPLFAASIGVYDIEKGKFETIELPRDVKFGNNIWKFSDTVVRAENKLIFIPCFYPAILVYDIASGKIESRSDIVSSLRRGSEIVTVDRCSFRFAFPVGNKVFIPYNQGNKIVVFDVRTFDYEVRTVGNANVAFCGIEFDGKDFWLPSLSTDGGLFRWNYETNAYTVFPFPHEITNEYNIGIYAVLRYGDKLRLIPSYDNSVWVFDIPTQTYCVDEVMQSECDIVYNANLHRGRANYAKPTRVGETLYVRCVKTNRLLEYNLETKQYRKEECSIPKSGLINDALLRSLVYGGEVIIEETINIEDLIDVLRKESTDAGNGNEGALRQRDRGKFGEAIWAHCAEQRRNNPL